MAENHELGAWGEITAMRYLDQHGYQIVEHDYQFKHKDIDIVARDECGTYVFVEVKTRSTNYMIERVMSQQKRSNLAKIIKAYCNYKGIQTGRVDLITIIGSPEHYQIIHDKSVMIPSLTKTYHKKKRLWW